MKRIVIDARESGTSTGRYVDKLIEYVYQVKPDYDIVLLAKPHRVDFLKQIAPDYQIITTPYKEFTFGEQLGFRKQITNIGADLVFFPMAQQPVLYRKPVVTAILDLTTARFRNPAKNPVVFWVKQQVYKFVTKTAAKKSKQLITISAFVKEDVVDYTHVSPNKITVTHLAADKIIDVPQPFDKAVDKKFILYVGRPQPHKNLERLVDAFKILQRANPSLYLVLAGKTDLAYEQLQEYVNQQKIPNVIFTGFVSDAQLRWLYEHATVYVFPSLSEGFGLPGLEAMQYNLPVASSNATCLPEVYKDAALYFNPFSTTDMANKIQKVLDDPKLAKKLAQNGKKLVATYSWKRMAEQTLAVFDTALS